MNELDSTVIETLERWAPSSDRQGDWADVLDRAGVVAPRRAGRLPRPWRLLAAVAVAGGAAALALAWPFGGSPGVVAEALAAVGNGRLTHVVLETSLGSSLVDLRTGRRTPVHVRADVWYDPKLGLIERSSFQGTRLYTVRLSPKQLRSYGDHMVELISGYRAALKSGSYRLVGSGTLAGRPIYWIEGKPTYMGGHGLPGPIQTVVQQVAISRSTYKPLFTRILVDGRVQRGASARVISIRSGPPDPAFYAKIPTHIPGYGFTYSSPTTTIAEAQAAMHRRPLIPPMRLGGLRRSWIGQPRYTFGTVLQSQSQFPVGIELYYGKLDQYGAPVYTGTADYISITEYPTANPVVRAMGEVLFPRNGQVLVQGDLATLEAHGFYVIITAGKPAAALAAARALGR